MTFGNGVFAAVGDDEKIYTSTDGDTWTKVYGKWKQSQYVEFN